MAIVTISRIQHRRGSYENLPQLSAAEFGWAVDQRRLFIGNGPVSEDAPEEGNTEILTEYSDVLSTAQTYTFKNSKTPFTVTTGPSTNAPVVRTMQNKFDDFASVLDFGAKGDGETDDTDAINRALFQLYCTQVFSGVQRALYFPAGHYIVSDYIKIPPHASLLGEGPFSTIIEQTGDPDDYPAVMTTADSLQNIGNGIGTNAALPTDILISNMGLVCALDGIYIQNCRRITLNRVRIVGPESLPTADTSSVALYIAAPSKAVYISGSAIQPSEDINMIDCYFNKFTYGIWQDNPDEFFQNVVINSATFDEMYEGIVIALNDGNAKNITVTSSVFNNIYSHAVDVNDVSNFTSSFNYYQEVGTQYAGGGSPAASIIKFGVLTDHSASLGDLFDRNDTDDLVFPRVESLNSNTSYIEYGDHIGIGYLSIQNGEEALLFDDTAGGSTGLSMKQARYRHAQISYHIIRNNSVRSGTLNISLNNTTYIIDDDSNETADVGVTFDVSADGTTASLLYTTTNTGHDATFRYSVKRLTDVV